MKDGALYSFIKRTGVIAAAIAAVGAIFMFVNGIFMAVEVKPAIGQLMAEERDARVKADLDLARYQAESMRDRGLILAALEAPTAKERSAYLQLMRERWMR